MKKAMRWFILIISIFTGIYLIIFSKNSMRFSQCIVTEEQYMRIMEARTEVDSLLGEVLFDEEALFYDAKNRTFYYSLIDGSASAYDPDIRIKNGTNGIEIAFLSEKITDKLIKDNQTIFFLAYDQNTFCQYELKCTTLPLLNIDCSMEIKDETLPMQMALFDNRRSAPRRVVYSNGVIHVRGASTRVFPKKGYRISLVEDSLGGHTRSNDISLLGMRQDDDWLLYAAYNDPEKIRNVFSSNLWQDSCAVDNAYGVNTGMEYKYLELFLNGEYWGLYALGYPIDQKQLQMDKENQREGLYKIIDWVDAKQFTFVNGGTIEGYKVQTVNDSVQNWLPLIRYYNYFYQNMYDNEMLRAGIDIDNAIDIYLFFNLIQGWDNVAGNTNYYMKNQYLSIVEGSEGLKAIYCPWDMDITWGAYGMTAEFNCIMESGYFNQLIENKDAFVIEKIFGKYRQLRAGQWSEEHINTMLDQYEADIFGSGAFLRDMERWPDGEYIDAAIGLESFRTYVMARLQETDLYYERLRSLVDQSIFIRRSTAYKDFLDHRFQIEIKDRTVLTDPDYVDLLAYIGVDIAMITEEIDTILASPSEGIYEYCTSLDIDEGTRTGMKMVLAKNDKIIDFDFSRPVDVSSYEIHTDTASLAYIYAAMVSGYQIIVEINNPDVWENTQYLEFFEQIGVQKGSIDKNTDFIVWRGFEEPAAALSNFHISGCKSDTPLGQLSLFINDEGKYGVYLNDNECFVSSQEEAADIRVVLFSSDLTQVSDMMVFTVDV